MLKTKQTGNEPVWDRENSTFVRTIYLTNGYTLTGYSKKVGRNERHDKIDLLTNWILRDLKNGYLDKETTRKITPLDRIEYYRRNGDNLDPIINLYYECPDWINTKWLDNKKLVSFINRLYSLMRKGLNAGAISNELEVRTRAPKQDPFDLSKKRFINMIDLNAYVLRLRNQSDLPNEAVDNFYRKYKEKYFTF
ncbi:MAG: hypothetical protein HOP30_13830 [Cyclobacteriaceae bacterium]|nr:hypothetical protein [Cyclobacteriaceae bacterium]